ncbi:MAG: hypothetical protein IT260_12505 [Saprospiraceae bacterium]|nr:hypothetical protein [Saprospiraceae bacterium]
MKNGHKFWIVASVVLLLCVFAQTDLWSQCPMCRMSAESNLKNGGTDGRGLNAGILYMLVLPYLLVGSIGLWWWRNRKRQAEDMEAPGDALVHE